MLENLIQIKKINKMKYIISFFAIITLVSCNRHSGSFSGEIASPVNVQKITKGNIQDLYTATGTVKSEFSVSLNTETSGIYFVQKNPDTGKNYKMGDYVKKGQTIIKIENKEFLNNINIKGIEIDLKISKMEYEKKKALYKKGGVTLRELVNGEKQLVSAQKNYDNAMLNLSKLSIIAPFDGVITKLPYFSQGVRIGNNVNVAQVMNYSKMMLDLMLPETKINKIIVGKKVNITNYSLQGDTLKGIVSQISPAVDEVSRTIQGRIVVDNKKMKLRPGMFVKADIIIQNKDSVLLIPKKAVVSRYNRNFVFIADKQTAYEKRIKIGLEQDGMIEVIRGLAPTDEVITKGNETLKDRAKIKIIK